MSVERTHVSGMKRDLPPVTGPRGRKIFRPYYPRASFILDQTGIFLTNQ